jgi:uncharacterized surface protein with fasciclin (FAS1) repeats/copper(I)-binding protein
MADMEATEEAVDVEATEEEVSGIPDEPVEEVTEVADMEATEEMVDMEATEEMADMEATEEAVDVEATEEEVSGIPDEPVEEVTEVADMEATEEMVDMEATEEMADMGGMQMGSVSAAYLVITNNGEEDVTLVSANAAAAGTTEVHQTIVENDVARMEEMADGLVIPAGESVALEPGGFHVMMLDLEENLVEGSTTVITLEFDNGESLLIEAPVANEAPAEGETYEVGDLTVEGVWVRPTAVMGSDEDEMGAMGDMEATEEAEDMGDMEATEEAEDMGGMEDVEMATYEGVYSFDYPADFDLAESGTFDLVTLQRGDQRIVVVGPDAYNAILGAQEFESDSEQLAFYLDRAGYDVGDETSMMMGLASYEVALPRNNQVGAATLVDLDNGRRGVVIELGPDADNVPGEEGAGIMGSIVYPADLVDVAVSTDGFNTLVAAVQAAGLEDTLRGGEFTVFAPTDVAFAAALDALGLTAEELLADTELLTSVLTYHVVEGTVTSDMLEDGMEVTTVNGATLTVNVGEDGVTLTDANGSTYSVVTPDVMASNGVVHVIDGVLLPPME